PRYVVVKGGHLAGEELVDILFDGTRFREYSHRRIPTRNTHGTGCTFSAAVATGLAKGLAVEEAVAEAKAFVVQALIYGARHSLGKGPGPLDQFGDLYQRADLSIVE
ncbi:MAG: bifunctional hydroxymethylpyrimidine kinase/phosphomethylpyrimidine kinase, partial [Chloroflexota bacterium]|nr:bifunctional hydroxymethylpyrimidine kinase/phosphomethylpyrimidine kinase [Chloroflexota bacterium]